MACQITCLNWLRVMEALLVIKLRIWRFCWSFVKRSWLCWSASIVTKRAKSCFLKYLLNSNRNFQVSFMKSNNLLRLLPRNRLFLRFDRECCETTKRYGRSIVMRRTVYLHLAFQLLQKKIVQPRRLHSQEKNAYSLWRVFLGYALSAGQRSTSQPTRVR